MLSLLLSLAWAGDASHHLDQARIFYKKGWLNDAALELETALASPEGQTMFEVWWLAAQVDYARMAIPSAIAHATGAVSVAPVPQAREQALALRDFLLRSFGMVEISGPPASATRLEIQCDALLLDTEVQQKLEAQAKTLQSRHELPLTVALPPGPCTLNGQAITVVAGQSQHLSLSSTDLSVAGLTTLQAPYLKMGMAMQGVFGPVDLPPAPSLNLGLAWPVGPVVILAEGAWAAWRYLAPGEGWVLDGRGFWGGLGVGTALALSPSLRLNPGLLLGIQQLPGFALSCVAGECVQGSQANQVIVHTAALALRPQLALAAEYHPPTAAQILGLQLSASGLWGQLAEAGSITGAQPYAWHLNASERPFSAIELHLQAYLGLTF